MRDKPYCNAPWLGVAYEGTQGVKPCCEWKGPTFRGTYTEYVKSEYLNNFKHRMYKDGPESTGCIECTHSEKVGSSSRRQYYDQYPVGLTKIVRLDFRAGNKCNMMCRMCGPESSSLLEEETVDAGERPKDFIKTIDTSDVYDLDLTDCEEISILGGEPSIDLKVRKFINYVADNYPKTKIMITTNATNASDKWLETLMKFSVGAGLQIILSVDATGPTQDFQRKSAIGWDKIKKNLLKYKKVSDQNNCEVSIQCTATAINMTTIDKWWDELLNIGIIVYLNQVIWPTGLSIDAMPIDYIHKSMLFLEEWQRAMPITDSTKYTNKIKTTKQAIRILRSAKYSEHSNKEFIKLNNRYDKLRNEDITKLDERFKVMMK